MQRDNQLSKYVFGKVQPQKPDLEQAVLGAIMLDKDALFAVIEIVSADSFYDQRHQLIYKAMLRLYGKSSPIDILTVTEELKSSGDLKKAGQAFYLVELTNRVASAANIEYHARIIQQAYMQRQIIAAGTIMIRDGYEDTKDIFILLDEAEKLLFDIQKGKGKTSKTPEELEGPFTEQIVKASKSDGLTGIPTGFHDLDRITSGWQRSDLIIVAARPGMGKTALVLAMARNAAIDFDKPIALFSLEMSNLQLYGRLVSMEAEIDSIKLRNGKLQEREWQDLDKGMKIISQAKIHIDDTPGINVFEIRAKCRKLKMEHDIQMIVVDYLQLMSGMPDKKYGTREQEISEISRFLKKLAKELNVPVVALSQLSRALESRGGAKRPQLSDLRESGALEQDADVVTFIYRPEYYSILEDEEGDSLKGIAEIIVAKHRSGALKTVKLRFTDKFAKFTNLDDPNFFDFPEHEPEYKDNFHSH